MKCVVPLAGPDLVHPLHAFRPLVPHAGTPLLQRALEQRSWRACLSSTDFVFVVRQVVGIETLETWLATTWPGCQVVRLPALTEGALLSCLAGVAAIAGDDGTLIIDLADILFGQGPSAPDSEFGLGVGACVPCFRSQDPAYSYLRCEDGRVVEAAEKRVISDLASAGVYMFRDRATFLDAAAHSLRHRAALSHRGALFVCPAINGVLASGLSVSYPMLEAVEAVGRAFHSTGS